MSNTVVGFTIDIDGIQTINQLNEAISKTKKEMKDVSLATEEGRQEYAEMGTKLGKLEAQSKALKKAQDDLNKSFLPEKSIGAYDKASAQLNKLRKEFKNAALDGSKSAAELDKMQKEIQDLDKTLKKVDGQVGQFQRNVGNYPRTFQRVQRSLMATIPGFEAFSTQLRNSEGNITSFGKALIAGYLAFQAVNKIGAAIGKLDEFNKKMEETRNTVQSVSGAYGESLDRLSENTTALASTFNTDAKTISEAAKALSQNMGISFEEALGKLEGALVEGRGDVNEYLNKVKEMPDTFAEAAEGTSDIEMANQKLLDSNKELAASQFAVRKEAKALGDEFKVASNAIQSTFIQVLTSLYSVFKPLFVAFYELGAAIGGFITSLFNVFSGGKNTISIMDGLAAVLNLVIAPLRVAINVVTGLVGVLKFLSPVIVSAVAGIVAYKIAVNAATIANKAQTAALFIYNGAIKLYTMFTNGAKTATQGFNAAMKGSPIGLIIAGAVAATTALVSMADATEDETKKLEDQAKAEKEAAEAAQVRTKAYEARLRAIEKAYQDEKKANDLKNAQGQLDDELYAEKSVEINKKRVKDIIAENEAQIRANNANAANGIAIAEGENDAILQSNVALQAELNQLEVEGEKLRYEAGIKKQKEYNDKLAKFQEEKKEFLKEEAEATKDTLAVIADLRARFIEEQIKNITDENERQIAEIRLSAVNQAKALDDELKKIQEENLKRQAEGDKLLAAAKLLQNKAEIADIEKQNAAARKQDAEEELEITNQITEIKKQINQKATADEAKVKEDARLAEVEKAKETAEELRSFRDRILNEELDYIDMFGEMRQLKNEEQLERALAQETDAKKRELIMKAAAEQEIIDEINVINQQNRALDDQKDYLDSQKKLGIEIKQEEYDAIALEKQKLNTKLAKLEGQQTANAKKEAEDRLKANIETFDKIAGYFKQGIDILGEIIQAANEKQIAQFEQSIEISQQRQSMLEEEINNATGLRRRFLEDRLNEEIAAEQRIAKVRDETIKKAAKQQKALALIQATINGALAITNILATTPKADFGVATAILIGLAVATTAAQIATIAAQPLAKGGVVGKLSGDIVQFSSGGKVVSSGNIKPLSNGDNVLATLRTGEVVLNESQQKKVGYTALKRANIPNFASGGVVGAPSAFVADQMSNANEEKQRAVNMQKLIEQTNGRIDRIQVVYTASTEDSVDKARAERKEIKAVAQF